MCVACSEKVLIWHTFGFNNGFLFDEPYFYLGLIFCNKAFLLIGVNMIQCIIPVYLLFTGVHSYG